MPSLVTLLGSCLVAASTVGTAYSWSAVDLPPNQTAVPFWPNALPDAPPAALPAAPPITLPAAPVDMGSQVAYPQLPASGSGTADAGSCAPSQRVQPIEIAPDPPLSTHGDIQQTAYEQDLPPSRETLTLERAAGDRSSAEKPARTTPPVEKPAEKPPVHESPRPAKIEGPPQPAPAATAPAAPRAGDDPRKFHSINELNASVGAVAAGRAATLPPAPTLAAAIPSPAAAVPDSPAPLRFNHDEKSATIKHSPLTAFVTVGGSLAIVLGLFLVVAWAMRKAAPRGSMVLPREVFDILGRARWGPASKYNCSAAATSCCWCRSRPPA